MIVLIEKTFFDDSFNDVLKCAFELAMQIGNYCYMFDCKQCMFNLRFLIHPHGLFAPQKIKGGGRRVSSVNRDAKEWHNSTHTAGNSL